MTMLIYLSVDHTGDEWRVSQCDPPWDTNDGCCCNKMKTKKYHNYVNNSKIQYQNLRKRQN